MSGYCERLDGAFWAEPLNAVTNAAFLLAAFLAFRLWRARGGGDWPAAVLIAIAFAIGVGSFLFHTVPARWSLLADVVPIQLFALGYFLLAMRRYLGLSVPPALLATAGFALGVFGLSWLLRDVAPGFARGIAGYGGFVIALFAVAALVRPRATARALAMAGLVFALSLTFRSLDRPLCDTLPFGTHFLWHLLNGTVLYILLQAAIRWRGRERA
jgi:hypothetical protein